MTKHMILTESESVAPTAEEKYPGIWIRLPTRGHCPRTGITRAMFYQLIQAGKIRSANLRRPGALRGVRLVWLPSVMAYLDKFASGGASK